MKNTPIRRIIIVISYHLIRYTSIRDDNFQKTSTQVAKEHEIKTIDAMGIEDGGGDMNVYFLSTDIKINKNYLFWFLYYLWIGHEYLNVSIVKNRRVSPF